MGISGLIGAGFVEGTRDFREEQRLQREQQLRELAAKLDEEMRRQDMQLRREQVEISRANVDANRIAQEQANALAALKHRDEQAQLATDRNVGMDAANVLDLPGMTDEQKALELQKSVFRNPNAPSAPAMLKMIEGLTRVSPAKKYRDIKLKGGKMMSVAEDQPVPEGTEFYEEPKSQAKPKIDIRNVSEAGPNGEPGTRVITFYDGVPISSQWIKGSLSASERSQMVYSDSSIASLRALEDVYRPEYVGPIAGRAQQLGQKIPGVPVDENAAAFYAASAAVRNAIIKAITGAQMSEPEAKRITSQIPMPQDKPEVWVQKWNQSLVNAQILEDAQRRIQGMPPKPKGDDSTGVTPPPTGGGNSPYQDYLKRRNQGGQ